MLVLALLAAEFRSVLSVPVSTITDALHLPTPSTFLSREIPECTDPASHRTTQEIIWSCLATVFLCTWVAIHPNVPNPRDSFWKNFRTRLVTMLYALIGPEFVTIWALRQRMGAAKHVKQYNKRFEMESRSQATTQRRTSKNGQKPHRTWTLKHGFLLEMHGLISFQNGEPFRLSLGTMTGIPWYTRDRLISATVKREGAIVHSSQLSDNNQYFDMSEDEIGDKSKGDSFTKLLVITQTLWFIVQCIARWATHLHVTELEIITLAFATLNIITYVLWWDKPLNMQVAIPIHVESELPQKCQTCWALVEGGDDGSKGSGKSKESKTNESEIKENRAECRVRHVYTERPREGFVNPLGPLLIMLGNDDISGADIKTNPETKVAFHSSSTGTRGNWSIALPVGFVGVLFGGLHLIPFWVSSFPSTWESYLWLAAAIWVIVDPFLISVTEWIFHKNVFSSFELAINRFPYKVGFLLYALSRLTLILLAFTGLRSLPPDAFLNVEWSTFFPHI